MSLSDDKHADINDAFNTSFRYFGDILNFNDVYFDNMVSQLSFSVLQFNKAIASDTHAAFLDLHLSISNSRGTKVEKMLTLAPERYTAGFCMIAKVIQWCI